MAKSAAIKYGKQLEEEEMTMILENLFHCENPLYSPSGKPIIMEMSKIDLEAFFKK
jgi:DNA mismatch repair protein MutL